MKRITIISHGLSDGGAERVASILANYFAKSGNAVLFIAAYSPEKEYKLNDNIKYVYIDAKEKNKFIKLIHRSWKINKEISDFHSDVIISFIINETIVSNLRHKIPIIYSLRIDPGIIKKKRFNWFMCKLVYGRAKKIVFQTKKARDFFDDNIRIKGVIIGNPLTPDLPYWNADNHKKVIMTACRLTKQKNLKMLIEGFARFHRNHSEYKLEIYGRGPLEDELKELVLKLRISDYVDFPGYTSDIHKIMSNAAVFALTSDFEGLSNSMLEALAIGVPCICTDCPPGGAAEYITDGENGMLVPVADTEGFKKKLCILADNDHLCRKLSRRAVLVRNKLDEKTILSQWNDIL